MTSLFGQDGWILTPSSFMRFLWTDNLFFWDQRGNTEQEGWVANQDTIFAPPRLLVDSRIYQKQIIANIDYENRKGNDLLDLQNGSFNRSRSLHRALLRSRDQITASIYCRYHNKVTGAGNTVIYHVASMGKWKCHLLSLK